MCRVDRLSCTTDSVLSSPENIASKFPLVVAGRPVLTDYKKHRVISLPIV